MQIIEQALTMTNNLILTGRRNRAIEFLLQIQKIDNHNEIASELMCCIATDVYSRKLVDYFGQQWKGESLQNKTIEIFCDQGMGDTIQMFRYLQLIKELWDCRIILNCYGFYDEFKRLVADLSFVDEFVNYHVKCDYNTNILIIPCFLDKEVGFSYPVNYEKLNPPDQPLLGPYKAIETDVKIGLAWKSNAENNLSALKSISVDVFSEWTFCSLLPKENYPPFVMETDINDLYDTACYIQGMNCVVTVDTVVLHLAGSMKKRTFGLLAFDCDRRWGKEENTAWYPSVTLLRQQIAGDWSFPLKKLADLLKLG